MERKRVVIMGAAGRDFHNFNCMFRSDETYEVVAITAAQIPNIDDRIYPAELAGKLYPRGVPIHPESKLESLIERHRVDEVWFSYSDVSHQYVMERAAWVNSWGARFVLASAGRTMLEAAKPVIAVTAVRTGAGKSQTTRYLARLLSTMGKKVVAVRHPMPYGDLAAQACQRFAAHEDLDLHDCTIEEREEYEPLIDAGFVVYAGVDYHRILGQAEAEAEILLWDGGNNDTPFYRPDLHITILDPHRPGHEISYYAGQTNFLLADLLIINKVETADPRNVQKVLANCARYNPTAEVVQCRSRIEVEDAELIRGKRVLVVEDGPTLTHGGMDRGAGWFAARDAGAAEIVDPQPFAVGSIRETFDKYPNARGILPAMGYGARQIGELEATINATEADVVIEGTPIDLRRVLTANKPIVEVSYSLEELQPGAIEAALRRTLGL